MSRNASPADCQTIAPPAVVDSDDDSTAADSLAAEPDSALVADPLLASDVAPALSALAADAVAALGCGNTKCAEIGELGPYVVLVGSNATTITRAREPGAPRSSTSGCVTSTSRLNSASSRWTYTA